MDASSWDARYAAVDLVWGADPNRFVADELTDLPPGRALDLACGEGRNALWLADRGWATTGVDFSQVAIERAQRLAAQAGLQERTRFTVADVVGGPLPEGPYDAIVVAYLQLPAGSRRTALRRAVAALAPGGTLLVVGHDTTNLTEGVGGPQDPTVLFTPRDVLADLADFTDLGHLAVEKAERVRRPVPGDEGGRAAIDALVRVRRCDDGRDIPPGVVAE